MNETGSMNIKEAKMNKYQVTFTQYYIYDVEAKDETEAENLAYREFEKDMRYPVARIHYDEVEIEESNQ